jgi:hypothetical protein
MTMPHNPDHDPALDRQGILVDPPDAEETAAIIAGAATAVAGSEGLLPMQRALLEAMAPAMTGHRVQLEGRPPVSAADLATALGRRTPAFRTRIVQIMVLCALLRHPIPDDVAAQVAAYASELGVDEEMVVVASDLAAGSADLAARDFERNGYVGTWSETELAAATQSSGVLREAWAFSESDPELAARWAALEQLPADAIGRKVWEMYQARGFSFPGTPGSAPPLLCQHDWVHVLADYGTTVESEVEVFGFIARANDDMHAFSLLAMVIALFETGDLARGAGLFEASPGHFSKTPGMAVRLSDAMRRGARCYDLETDSDSIDFLRMDWLSIAHVPCTTLRDRFGVVTKSDDARAARSVGPWEPGGISPFQMESGRKLAADHGIPYDAHGAAVTPSDDAVAD